MRADPFTTTERPSDRPGPGPIPLPTLARLDLYVRRRLEGLLTGDIRSAVLGHGMELHQVRPYVPGDDVRWMEWNVTARTGAPHVRVLVAERSVTTLLLLDRSASMNFGTAERRKTDVAEGVVLAVAHLSTRRGARLALTTFGEAQPRSIAAQGGRRALLGALETMRTDPPSTDGAEVTLAPALSRASGSLRRRGVVVVVSDLRGPLDWRRSLAGCAQRHETAVIEVRDPREESIPDVGGLWLVDPETGRTRFVDTANRRLRARYEAAAAAERAAVRRDVIRAGARHIVLSTHGDWLQRFAVALSRPATGVA